MGEVKEIDLVAELRKDNKEARAIDLQIFADALKIYLEAAANVSANGAICAHPRTGAPVENPYLKVQAQAAGVLSKMRFIKSERVVRLL